MSRNPSPLDQAYNASVVALNEAESDLLDAFSRRERAWLAADAIHSGTGHGAGLISQKRIEITPKRKH